MKHDPAQPGTTAPDIVWCLRANADDCEQNDEPFSGARHQAALDREAADEIIRLRGLSNLLARSLCGISPDTNTQTEAEIAATEQAVNDAIEEALQFHA